MRDPHGADEVFLEPRLGRRLDLLDAADDVLDLVASRAVEQGDARAGAGGVARAGDVLGLAVGNQDEHPRVNGIDVGAERTGQPDPVDVIDPVVIHQQATAGVEGALRQLDLADVVLGEHEPRLGVVDDVGARAYIVDHALGALFRCRIDHAVGRQDPGEVQLGDQLDDARAADAGRRGGAGLVGPSSASDGAEAKLERLTVDADAFDRAGRGALTARDLRALEGGAGGARGGEQPVAVPEHDLGVRADVDQEIHDVLFVGRLRQDHPGGVGADVAGDQRQGVHTRARVGVHADVASGNGERAIGDGRERGAAELRRVEPEDEVVHDWVPDHDELQYVVARGVGL